MTRALLVSLLLAAGCKKPPPPPPPVVDAGEPEEAEPVDAGIDDPHEWQTYAGDGALLRSKSIGSKCYVECSREGERVWESVGACVAVKSERRFVGPDCERTVVFIAAPPRGKPWAQTEVMRVYRRGELDYAVQGAAVLPEDAMKTSTSWLKGCYGEPGQEPRYTKDGSAVEYEMIDGKAGKVELVPPPPPPPAPTKAKPKPKKRK